MASAKGGSVPSGVGYEKGCPLSSRLRGLGERRELSQRGRGRPTERTFCTYMTKSGGGGQFTLASPAPHSGGDLSPRPPVIYAHGRRHRHRPTTVLLSVLSVRDHHV